LQIIKEESDPLKVQMEGHHIREEKNRILIVDDNDFNSFSLQELLKQNFNLGADIAVHGLDAVERVR
jgi:CheY-like chemotaxis protein